MNIVNSLLVFGAFGLISCHSILYKSKDDPIKRKVIINSTFSNRIIDFNKGELTGADGTISIDLKDGRSLFLWGDSFFGKVVNGI